MLSLLSRILPGASREIVLDLKKRDGSTEQQRVPISDEELQLEERQLVAVSDNIVQLTRVTYVTLDRNALAETPAGVLAMTQLTFLSLHTNQMTAIPREIGRLRALTRLYVSRHLRLAKIDLFRQLGFNKLVAVPHEIGELRALTLLDLADNKLTSLPAELGQLTSLKELYLQRNSLAWLPLSLDRLPVTIDMALRGNPLPAGADRPLADARSKLPEIFAATTALAMIRPEATTLAIGLQDLELPALVTLEIVDAAFPNSIPMHKKWDLITAVKHFEHC